MTPHALHIVAHGEPEALRWSEIPWPIVEASQVCVDVHAVGVNYPDLLVVRGQYQTLAPLPFAPGKEVAGVIVQVGTGVDDLKVGQRVLGYLENGGYAERLSLRAADCCVLPDGLDCVDAIGLGLGFQTAHFALFERAALKPGDTVLVTGATGAVGSAALQLAKAHGAFVIAAIGTTARARFASEHGADRVVVTNAERPEALRYQVRQATGGRGVDVVIESVGSPVFEVAMRSLARSGRIIVVGFAGGPPASLRSNYLLIKNLSAMGLHWSDYRDDQPDLVRAVQQQVFAQAQAGKLRSPVTTVLSLRDAAIALRRLAERQSLGKFVLVTDRYDGRHRPDTSFESQE